jgi:D-xylose transport system substrate-binding protein
MKKILTYSTITLCLMVFLLITSCKAPLPVQDTKDIQDQQKLLIGFSMATYKEDRWLRDRDIFLAKAQEAGFNVIVQNANNDAEQQYQQILDMIAKGIDVLVIAPHDAIDAKRAVAKAKAAGIPVISYDRLVREANVDVYISFDNVRVGELMGEALKKAVPKGGYILLNGSKNDNNSAMFREGYLKSLDKAIKNGQIEIIAETWIDDWRREIAYEYTYNVLKNDATGINGIVAANDSLAWAAIDALSENRLIKQVKVVGHDADLAACKRLIEGSQLMTVYKPIPKLVDETIALCKTLASNKKLTITETLSDGKYDVPYIRIDVVAVTKDNLEETVIKDGFHLKEDLYN